MNRNIKVMLLRDLRNCGKMDRLYYILNNTYSNVEYTLANTILNELINNKRDIKNNETYLHKKIY